MGNDTLLLLSYILWLVEELKYKEEANIENAQSPVD